MQNGINESFWDGLGVEFKAKYVLDFRGAPRTGGRAGPQDMWCTEIAQVGSTNVICLNLKTRPLLGRPWKGLFFQPRLPEGGAYVDPIQAAKTEG